VHEKVIMETEGSESAATRGNGSDLVAAAEPRIIVTEHGPYRVVGEAAIYDAEGMVLRRAGTWCLCRCGGSRNKPFCDATHGIKGFDGTESADHGSISDRRDTYDADGITVFDDRSRCAHFGQCTDRLPAVFRADAEPFVDPDGAPPAAIAGVVAGCPSGALAYAVGRNVAPVEADAEPSIAPIVDGPYRVRGNIQVVAADGRAYEGRQRQTLCRCGQSGSKPFCDGSHWYAGFRDPLPKELVKQAPTLFEWVGGLEALERLTSHFYDAILSEPTPFWSRCSGEWT
jgi:CDGSH-type Zn-finger protein